MIDQVFPAFKQENIYVGTTRKRQRTGANAPTTNTSGELPALRPNGGLPCKRKRTGAARRPRGGVRPSRATTP